MDINGCKLNHSNEHGHKIDLARLRVEPNNDRYDGALEDSMDALRSNIKNKESDVILKEGLENDSNTNLKDSPNYGEWGSCSPNLSPLEVRVEFDKEEFDIDFKEQENLCLLIRSEEKDLA